MAKNINWKNVIVAVLIIAAVLFLLSIVFRGCDPAPKLPDPKPVIEEVKKADKEMKSLTDSAKLIQLKDDTIRQLRAENMALKQAREKAGKELERQAAKILELDEPDQIIDCDSLAHAAVEYQLLTEEELRGKDKEIQVLNRKINTQEEIIVRQTQLYNDLRSSFTELQQQNSELTKIVKKETRKRKGAKTLNRILAGAVIIAGGLILTK